MARTEPGTSGGISYEEPQFWGLRRGDHARRDSAVETRTYKDGKTIFCMFLIHQIGQLASIIFGALVFLSTLLRFQPVEFSRLSLLSTGANFIESRAIRIKGHQEKDYRSGYGPGSAPGSLRWLLHTRLHMLMIRFIGLLI